MRAEALQALRDFLARDSRPGASFGATIDYLMDRLFYGEFRIFEQVSSSAYADYVQLIGLKDPGNGAAPLWLVGHFGSGAEPAPASWSATQGEPLRPRIDAERGLLYGLGAANAKLDLVLKLLVASRVDKARLKRPICLIGLSGDESHGLGLEDLLDGRFARPSAALIAAPTNLELWTQHPGSVTLRLNAKRTLRHRRMPSFRGMFELDVSGRSSHVQACYPRADALTRGLHLLELLRAHGDLRVLSFSGGEGAHRCAARCRIQVATSFETLPPLPDYAQGRHLPDGVAVPLPIDKMLMCWLRALKGGLSAVSGALGLDHYAYPARPRVDNHTGWIKSERDTLSGEITLWTGPASDPERLVERFAEAVHAHARGGDENELEIEVVHLRPPFDSTSLESSLLTDAKAALKDAGLPAVVSSAPYVSDAGRLAHEGIPALLFGPGRGLGDLYQDDERLPVLHIGAAYKAYEAMIERLCC